MQKYMKLLKKIKTLQRYYFTYAKTAKKETGKNYLQQLSEIRQTRQYAGQCGAGDYYRFKLYDDEYLHGEGRKDFIGWRIANEFTKCLNPRQEALPGRDKFVFTQIAEPAGLPTISTVACFHPSPNIPSFFGQHLKNRDEVQTFLRNTDNYPLFAKPAFSQQGIGACYLKYYSASDDLIHLMDGNTVSLAAIIDRIFTTVDSRYHKPECGFIFQQPLTMPDELVSFTQWPTISSLRVICLNSPDGAFPIRAVWKVAVRPNQLDNFSLGRFGNSGKYRNLVADVNLTTGEISRLIDGMHPEAKEYHHHPVSNIPVKGFVLNQWPKILDICKLGGKIFPLMKIHHWDIAMTNHGPKIIELNDLGGIEIAQIHGHGLLGNGARDFIKVHGNKTAFPWINKL